MGFEKTKRITIFAGHYGSGKTEVALNFALSLKKKHERVIMVDLDVVNPYYRTEDARTILEENKITLISPSYANTNVEAPALPADVNRIFDDKAAMSVIDVGGDDDGATVLGRYKTKFADESFDFYAVINGRRPLTASVEDTVKYLKDIEQSSRLKLSGIINNTNLSYETDEKIVLNSDAYAKEVANNIGVPLIATTVLSKLYPELLGKIQNLIPININIKHDWL
jgi:hypothetical protein